MASKLKITKFSINCWDKFSPINQVVPMKIWSKHWPMVVWTWAGSLKKIFSRIPSDKLRILTQKLSFPMPFLASEKLFLLLKIVFWAQIKDHKIPKILEIPIFLASRSSKIWTAWRAFTHSKLKASKAWLNFTSMSTPMLTPGRS